MNLVEFEEKISPITLTDLQNNFLVYYEQIQKEDMHVFICFPPKVGSRLMQILREYEKEFENVNNGITRWYRQFVCNI